MPVRTRYGNEKVTRARDHLLVTSVDVSSEFLDDLRGEGVFSFELFESTARTLDEVEINHSRL